MNLCKLLGHKLKRDEVTGISPKLLKVIHRVVYYCERNCGFREQHDSVIADFDIKEGINLWGSGGVCYGCKRRQTCPAAPENAVIEKTSLSVALLTGGFCYMHCPIHSFEIREEEAHRLSECGDILIP